MSLQVARYNSIPSSRRGQTAKYQVTMKKLAAAAAAAAAAAKTAAAARSAGTAATLPVAFSPAIKPPLLCSLPAAASHLLDRHPRSGEQRGTHSVLPALFSAGAFGLLSTQLAHADAGEDVSNLAAATEAPIVPEASSEASGAELATQERRRLEELLRERGLSHGSYPPYVVSVRGTKVTIKFKIPPACEISSIIVSLASHLGLKAEQDASGSEMIMQAWDSVDAWQIILQPQRKKEIDGEGSSKEMHGNGDFCILIFELLAGAENREMEFIKKGSFTYNELDALVSALKLAGGRDRKRPPGRNTSRAKSCNKYDASVEKLVSSLEAMGVRVYGFHDPQGYSMDCLISWENIAGYDHQKREIEDTILLALRNPKIYDDIAHGTRVKFESNRPRAVLFEGPPGTGKTSTARVIAKQACVPLLYVPLEIIMSKYYGESERLLGEVFSLANELPEGAIIFLDEVDSFAIARDSEMHESTRRILSVILRQIDGFEQDKQVVLIAATNRKQDLDPALISRFDSMITFGLPDLHTREEITAQYAKHLKKSELVEFALVTEKMSGRDIRDVCQQAERTWASKLLRGVASSEGGHKLPPMEEYIRSAEVRRKALEDISERRKSRSLTLPLAYA